MSQEITDFLDEIDDLEEVIVYKALYQGEFKFGQIWARKINDFLGTVEKNGEQINRFNLVEE